MKDTLQDGLLAMTTAGLMISTPSIACIIFLDFDGVLNSDKLHEAPSPGFLAQIEADTPCEPTLLNLARQLDPDLVARLLALVTMLDAGIVFSSSWRLLIDLEDMTHFFSRYFKFPPDCFLGYTPGCGAASRGLEIQTWIRNNTYEGQYLILDDMPVEEFLMPQRCRLLQTDHRIGLTGSDITKAFELFN
jgi:hypothetical protein